MRTAVCFAGAWRDWPSSWSHILPNLIEPLGDVHIYAISDTLRFGPHGVGDTSFTVARMRETFGSRFKAGERLTPAHLSNVTGRTWPEIVEVQEALPKHSTVFAYLYKIWRCGQLIHQSGVAYDLVIRLRPDLWPTQPFRIARVGSIDANVFELQVGGRCTRFGPKAVVIHAYTNYCANDWIAIGSLKAMTVTLDLLRFWTPVSRFLSPDESLDATFSQSVEMAHNWLWWRTGTAVHRQPLFIELARRRCSRPGCIRMPAWQIMRDHDSTQEDLHESKQMGRRRKSSVSNASSCVVLPEASRPSIGSVQQGRHGLVNDCGAPGGIPQDLEWFSGATPSLGASSQPPEVLQLPSRGRAKRLGRIEPPRSVPTVDGRPMAWSRPACTDVADLAAHNPLLPCHKLSGDDASYQPQAHRPVVHHGYGTPLCFNCEHPPSASLQPADFSAVAAMRLAKGPLAPTSSAYLAVRAEMDALKVSAQAARANQGDVSRLDWNVRRCLWSGQALASGAAHQRPPELRVLVVGCSMTQGFMNCGTTLEGKQCTVPCDGLAWYRVLGRHLQAGLPGCKVVVLRSTSRGGRTLTTAQRYDTRVRKFAPHIIVTDLTVCDLRGITSSIDGVRVQAGMEVLIRRALSEVNAPALVHVESWAELNPMGTCKSRSAHKLHLPIAEHYGVPVTSFMLGACAHEPESALRRHWLAGCSPNASSCTLLDTWGSECEPHPGPHTHRVFALIVAELILGQAVRVGADDRHAAFGPPVLPPPPLNETAVQTILPAATLAILAPCRAHHGTGQPLAMLDFADGQCGQPTRSSSWRCYADRPGKPGWISETDQPGAQSSAPLSFDIPLPNNKLTIGYLRSYDARMGTARVWLDDDSSAAMIMNGSWTSRTSQTDLTVARVSQLCGPTCRSIQRGAQHRIHIERVAGRKFKLLSVELC